MQLTSQFSAKIYKLNLEENSFFPPMEIYSTSSAYNLDTLMWKLLNKNNTISPLGIGTEIR